MTLVTMILCLRFLVRIPIVSAIIMSLTGYILAGIISSIDMLIILKLTSQTLEDFKTNDSLLALNITSESMLNLLLVWFIHKKRWGFSFLSKYRAMELKQNIGFFIFIVLSILLISFFLNLANNHYFDVFSVILLFSIVSSFSFYLSYLKESLD